MANLRDVRLRMRAIRQTLQVTKAMHLISTAKLRKGRRILHDVEPFFSRIEKTMFDILSGAGMVESKFLEAPKGYKKETAEKEAVSRTAIVVITSDKGLAGGYNANIFHQVERLCSRVKNPGLIVIGDIGLRHFTHSSWPILEHFSLKAKLPDLENARKIADYIISQYLLTMFAEVHIVYTHMYSSVKQAPRDYQLLPLSVDIKQKEFEQSGKKRKELQFEYLPSKNAVFEHLVPFYIKGSVFACLVEAYASEQSARMYAMNEASKSAEEMLSTLQTHYNRVRQASITQEITEIIGGAEGLKN
jgi:F-type H+-transporting ATPase subunit gamma